MNIVFKLTSVSVRFAQRKFKPQRLKYALAHFFIEQEKEQFQALSNACFSIQQGENTR